MIIIDSLLRLRARCDKVKPRVKVYLPLLKDKVELPVGVEMRSNCESFMSEAMLTPLPEVHW